MAGLPAYATYKRKASFLLYWMIHAFNNIIRSLPNNDSLRINTSGQTTASGLVSMSQLVGKHLSPIPDTILRLFVSVIDARTNVNSLFEQMAVHKPSAELKQSNDSHRHFIDALSQAFGNLGGHEWQAAQAASRVQYPDNDANDDDDLEKVIFSNKFSALHVDGDDDEHEEESDSGIDVTKQQTKPRKGRKVQGKGKKKAKKSRQGGNGLDKVPLESYRFVHDDDGEGPGVKTGRVEYVLAVSEFFTLMGELRMHIQKEWHEVAYDGLNVAVAAVLTNVTVQIVRQKSTVIFLDFPGHDSYNDVVNGLTGGDIELLQDNVIKTYFRFGQLMAPATRDVLREKGLDAKDLALYYTYANLCDFIRDFRLNRTGVPTKRMLRELKDWDPTFNLQEANHEQRMQWRRVFTINWLYDLVNLMSAPIAATAAAAASKGPEQDLADVDWSPGAAWRTSRRLFGLEEFACFVTSLAFQKPGADIKSRILPHHVFQLQCIVDSMTIPRGWETDGVQSHELSPPAPSFDPRRDLDKFKGSPEDGTPMSFNLGMRRIWPILHDAEGLPKSPGTKFLGTTIENLDKEFRSLLAGPKFMAGIEGAPVSRFASTSDNGLWEYSPYLCGAGLLQALELSHNLGMAVLDTMPQLGLFLHLHHMLTHKGFLKESVTGWKDVSNVFVKSLYRDGELPRSGFREAYINQNRRHYGHNARRHLVGDVRQQVVPI